jgi:hypothetical protein
MAIFNPFDPNNMPEPPLIDGEERTSNSSNAGKNSAAEQGLEVPMGWKPTAKEPVPVVRCKAMSTTTGERCKRWSIRGTTVCQSHGGRLPNVVEHSQAVVESARMNLMGMTEDAVEVIRELLQAGTAEAVRLKAAENVLNRSGIKEAMDVKVEVDHRASPSEGILQSLQTMRERFEKEKREAEEAEQEILEAEEIIEEEIDTEARAEEDLPVQGQQQDSDA